MRSTLFYFFLLITFNLSAQNFSKKTAPIVEEGIRLYKLEMAAWIGTDIYLAKNKDVKKVDGYFAYSDKYDATRCIFFSKDAEPKVIGEVTFTNEFTEESAKSNFKKRAFTESENQVYLLRKKSLDLIARDTFFKKYDKMNLNLIPIIYGRKKKVYIMTGPQINNVVVYGNDYLLTFNKKNKLRKKKALHKNMMTFKYGGDKNDVAVMHSHTKGSGEFISATDICTTMLYEKFTEWKTKIVISKKYVSIWDCQKDKLTIMTREAFDALDKPK